MVAQKKAINLSKNTAVAQQDDKLSRKRNGTLYLWVTDSLRELGCNCGGTSSIRYFNNFWIDFLLPLNHRRYGKVVLYESFVRD